jgi:hypothetical protein
MEVVGKIGPANVSGVPILLSKLIFPKFNVSSIVFSIVSIKPRSFVASDRTGHPVVVSCGRSRDSELSGPIVLVESSG